MMLVVTTAMLNESKYIVIMPKKYIKDSEIF